LKFLLLSLIALSFFLTGCSNNSQNEPSHNTTDSYNTQKLSVSESIINTPVPSEPIEEPLSSFSTNILRKDPDRTNNINLACNSLNGYIVKPGETFSFCNILGPATPEDGYKKANAFDADGNTIQAYGGGKCQVSSTLYNAVAQAPGLTVLERHDHSAPVYYVELGQDACVNYGTCDFKFRNDNNYDIKLYFSNTEDSVNVSIVKISS